MKTFLLQDQTCILTSLRTKRYLKRLFRRPCETGG